MTAKNSKIPGHYNEWPPHGALDYNLQQRGLLLQVNYW